MSAFSTDNFPTIKNIPTNQKPNSIVDYYQDFALPMVGKQAIITRRTTDTVVPYKVTQNNVNSELFKLKDEWF